VARHLLETHGFTFTQDERETLKYVFDAFVSYGPSIATRGISNGSGGDFAQLTGFSTDSTGTTELSPPRRTTDDQVLRTQSHRAGVGRLRRSKAVEA
jgi:hypothetical protein